MIPDAVVCICNPSYTDALRTTFGSDADGADAMLVPAKPEFGDYQCNAAMPLAKKLKKKPREIAEALMTSLNADDVLATMDISGPGFINMKISNAYIQVKIASMLKDPKRIGVPTAVPPKRIVVDFSSPNIAKEMHVVSSEESRIRLGFNFLFKEV